MKIKTLCIAALCTVSLAGCSVKADRTDCACLLRLKVSGSDENIMDYDWEVADNHERGRVSSDDAANAGVVELEVSRGLGTLTICSGIHGCYQSMDQITVPYGFQMDEVYANNVDLDTRCDLLSTTTRLHRQHAFIYMDIIGASSDEYPYMVSICGNICGLNTSTFSPIPGPFRHVITPVIGETCRVCVPRQMDNSLTLQFFSKSNSKAEGDRPESLPIGNYIAASGYDWTQEDLSDIYLEVDFSKADVSIGIIPWDTIEGADDICQ